jgi:hypothetical protein
MEVEQQKEHNTQQAEVKKGKDWDKDSRLS